VVLQQQTTNLQNNALMPLYAAPQLFIADAELIGPQGCTGQLLAQRAILSLQGIIAGIQHLPLLVKVCHKIVKVLADINSMGSPSKWLSSRTGSGKQQLLLQQRSSEQSVYVSMAPFWLACLKHPVHNTSLLASADSNRDVQPAAFTRQVSSAFRSHVWRLAVTQDRICEVVSRSGWNTLP
jgi:hypothetical protein